MKVSEEDPMVAVFGGECPSADISVQQLRPISDIYMLNLRKKVLYKILSCCVYIDCHEAIYNFDAIAANRFMGMEHYPLSQ